MVHWIFLKCMAQRLVRLQFDFNCSFVFMISVYFDVNSFKLFLYVSAYFCLLIGGGGGGGGGGEGGYSDSLRCWGTPTQGDIRRKCGDLKSRGHHGVGFKEKVANFVSCLSISCIWILCSSFRPVTGKRTCVDDYILTCLFR